MPRRHPPLEKFLDMAVPNLYIQYKSMECYMRKGRVYIDGKVRTALTIGNIKNLKRRDNFEVKENPTRTGLFAEFEELVRQKAAEHGYEGVYVELVYNEFLPDVLTRYGYQRVNIRGVPGYQEKNYWRPVKDDSDEQRS